MRREPLYKGILLAGGQGTRLDPLTRVISKQLLPVYDKPMIYYPLSVLMLSNIREIAIVHDPRDGKNYKKLLGDGSQLGMKFHYMAQKTPGGLAHGLLCCEEIFHGSKIAFILGDNLFYGQRFGEMIREASQNNPGVSLFAQQVRNPQDYGVVELCETGAILSLEEKPKSPHSNLAVTGLYLYDENVFSYAKTLRPSLRGELEITDLNKLYLKEGKARVNLFSRGFFWMDAGTPESLMECSDFVRAIERRNGLKIGCPEEVAFRMGWINETELMDLAKACPSNYGEYLRCIKR